MLEFNFCCFPYISYLQKGLLKVKSGGQHSSTILEGTQSISSLFCWAQSSWQYSTNTVWTPKECRDGGEHEAAESLPCPEGGLLQGCTGHCWKGKQTSLVDIKPLRNLISPAAAAADQLFEEGIILLSRCSWASSFYSPTSFLTGNATFYNLVYKAFILDWALS